MSYDQSSYLFYGVEVEWNKPWYEFAELYESYNQDGVVSFSTGNYSMGEFLRHFFIVGSSLHKISDGRYVMSDAIHLNKLEDKILPDYVLSLYKTLEKLDLKPASGIGWIIASFGS